MTDHQPTTPFAPQQTQQGQPSQVPQQYPPVPTQEQSQFPERKGAGLAITAFVLGLVALLLCLIPIINNFAFVLGLIGLVLGVIGLVGARKGKRAGKGLAVAAVVLSVLAMIGVIASQAVYSAALTEVGEGLEEVGEDLDTMAGENTDVVLTEMASVQLGQFAFTEGEFGVEESSLPITVTNITQETLSYDFTIEAKDAAGARIETDIAFAQTVAAGQSVTVEAFQFVSDAARFQGAIFSVIEASAY